MVRVLIQTHVAEKGRLVATGLAAACAGSHVLWQQHHEREHVCCVLGGLCLSDHVCMYLYCANLCPYPCEGVAQSRYTWEGRGLGPPATMGVAHDA
jgi:hypothetical protein